MDLFVILLALGFLQVWGNENPLHKDTWFANWTHKVNGHFNIASPGMFLVSVGGPILLLLILLVPLYRYVNWLMLPLGVFLLLYSFGRGEFSGIVTEYTKACGIEDWEAGLTRAARLGVHTEDLQENDWNALHSHVLDEAGYRGFERMFAILFWFFVLGPVGAVAYRLLFLFNRQFINENDLAKRVLWMAEWPAVRVLGLSFAMTGNFVGCYRHWRDCLICPKRSTVQVLSPMILGALSVDDDISQTCEVTRKELSLLERLYTRTLWFWLAAASIIILLA